MEGISNYRYEVAQALLAGKSYIDAVKDLPSPVKKLHIDPETLEKIKTLLIKLGNTDINPIVSKLYFTLSAGCQDQTFYTAEGAEQLFAIGQMPDQDIETYYEDTSKPLPIGETEYIELAGLLGNAVVNDKEVYIDDEMAGYSITILGAFQHLQKRARNANGFQLTPYIDGLEDEINKILESITTTQTPATRSK